MKNTLEEMLMGISAEQPAEPSRFEMPESSGTWSITEAIAISTAIENIIQPLNCHVALTGGLLYKGGQRKDADFVFYNVRQKEEFRKDVLFEVLKSIGLIVLKDFGFVAKATYAGKHVDLLFPDHSSANSPTRTY